MYPSTLGGGSWIRETLHRHHVALPSTGPYPQCHLSAVLIIPWWHTAQYYPRFHQSSLGLFESLPEGIYVHMYLAMVY